ncbi:MAG: hypothetical protein ACRDZO_27260 [Egibacteraceae bacterium]
MGRQDASVGDLALTSPRDPCIQIQSLGVERWGVKDASVGDLALTSPGDPCIQIHGSG